MRGFQAFGRSGVQAFGGRTRTALWGVLVLAVGVLAGCGGGPSGVPAPQGGNAPAPSRAVTVFAATSLRKVFEELKPAFQTAHPGVQVEFNFGASSELRTQIEQGAPADVFASADTKNMEALATGGLVGTLQIFARNRLALVTPAANPGKLEQPQDLAKPGLRLVTTDPAVPIGRYTQQVLAQLGEQPGYPREFAALVNKNVASRERNVGAVLSKVELGEADAGFVYETDARGSDKVKSIPLPPAANVMAEYPIAVVKASKQSADAEAFLQFVLSPQGQDVLKRSGFLGK